MNSKWLVCMGLIVLGCALLVASGPALADMEPNDDFMNAESITPGDHSGDVNTTNPVDFYMFDAKEGDIFNVTLDADPGAMMTLYNATEVMVTSAEATVGNEVWHMLFTANETMGPWYVNVSHTGENATYVLTLAITKQDDAGMGIDAPGVAENAIDIMGMMMIEGILADLDTMDYYMIEVGGGDYGIVMLIAMPGTTITILNSTMVEVFSANAIDYEVMYMFITASETPMETMYIKINNTDMEMAAYMLVTSVVQQDDAGTGEDAPADPEMGETLDTGEYNGTMGMMDEIDSYMVTVNAGWSLYVNLSNNYSVGMEAKIMNETMVVVETLSSVDNVTDEGMWVIPDGTPTDATWYIVLNFMAPDNGTEYYLDVGIVEVIPDTEAPVITHTSPTDWQETIDMMISADVTDDVAVTGVTLWYRITGGTTFTEMAMAMTTGDTYEATIPGASVTAAGVEYYMSATDDTNEAMNPEGGASDPVAITSIDPPPDTEDPMISGVNIPETGHEETEGVTVTFSGQATDNVGVDSLGYTLDGGSSVELTMTVDDFTFDLVDLAVGEYTVVITAMDADGNTAEYTSVFNVVAVPNTPPVITSDFPLVYESKKSTVTITGTATDAEGAVTVTASINLGAEETLTMDGDEWTYEITGLEKGIYAVIITATDSDGAFAMFSTGITVLELEDDDETDYAWLYIVIAVIVIVLILVVVMMSRGGGEAPAPEPEPEPEPEE